jgi:hypothetical protein
MNSGPSAQIDLLERIHKFVVVGASNELTDEHWAEFERLLRENDDACRLYAQYVDMSVLLPAILSSSGDEESPTLDPFSAELQGPANRSAPGFLQTALHGTVGYCASGWPVAYLVATVILGLGVLVGSLIPASPSARMAVQSVPRLSPLPAAVGRITGMVDCQWNKGSEVRGQGSEVRGQGSEVRGQGSEADNPKSQISNSESRISDSQFPVAVGDRFALASGLMEITYDSGARVILQGPVTYEVESAAGGFLSVGKLTARLEKGEGGRGKAEGGRRKGEGGRGKGEQSPNLQISRSPNRSSLVPRPSPLFVVRTPSAIITDLGTEFGVEVAKSGRTVSHVFRGTIRVQAVAARGQAEESGRIVRENESVRVDDGAQRKTVVIHTLKPSPFIRELPKRTVKLFDLVDVVAGGDGFSHRRGAGIRWADGRVVNAFPPPSEDVFVGDGKYHRAASLPLVDGIFVPNGPTQVDSAGHRYDFPPTANRTAGYVWAGGLIPLDPPVDGRHTSLMALDGVDYSSPGHGVLSLHANRGITFDLEAIRQANPGYRVARFRATAGDTNLGLTDVWVLVDGQVRFRRREINVYNGGFAVAVAIGEHDRFLTLAATDAGDDIGSDWSMFGDPRLELAPAKTAVGPPSP